MSSNVATKFCHYCGFSVEKGYSFCPNCGTKLSITAAATNLLQEESATNSNWPNSSRPAPTATTSSWPKLRKSNFGLPGVPSFKKFKQTKEAERQSFSVRKGNGKRGKIKDKEGTINIGILQTNGAVKRGENLPLKVFPASSSPQMILEAAVEKHSAFNKRFQKNGSYNLVYKDGTEVIKVPGTDQAFTPQLFKEVSGLGYARIVLYLQKQDILAELKSAIASSSDTDSDPDDLQLINWHDDKELGLAEHGNDGGTEASEERKSYK